MAALVVARRHAEIVAVALAEMGRGNEAAAYRHLHHRHLRLAEKLARPLEPEAQIVAGGRAVHELAEQPLDIAARLAELGREGQQVERLLDVLLHQLDGGRQFLPVDAGIGLDRHVLAHRSLADLVVEQLFGDGYRQLLAMGGRDPVEHHVHRGGAAGTGEAVAVDLEQFAGRLDLREGFGEARQIFPVDRAAVAVEQPGAGKDVAGGADRAQVDALRRPAAQPRQDAPVVVPVPIDAAAHDDRGERRAPRPSRDPPRCGGRNWPPPPRPRARSATQRYSCCPLMWLASRSGSRAAVNAIIENRGISRNPTVSGVLTTWPMDQETFLVRVDHRLVLSRNIHLPCVSKARGAASIIRNRCASAGGTIGRQRALPPRRGISGDEIRHIGPHQRLPPPDDVGQLLRHHDRRRVEVAGGDQRHDRRVDHPQAFHAMHPALPIDHGHVVGAHPARAGRMVRGFAMLADELVQLGIGLEIDAGADLPPAIGVQRLLLDDLAGDADAGAEFLPVLGLSDM